ncbi:hypothetical protein MPTK1_1g03780 [Marchantia polymorpha subsp. ruderalis]|uniref:Uncharacterized protein n=2 Tax=Marchantia polymorpha TaxID=3197 RepID=A0AAF6AL78_MARPO|nr:hypothetical protein MARPO_0005s0229 [Marchantia polymorpha]BBM97198.1 hypothetical protein Mp_1g03780 [Marchantia polymorpha subsp. ruderalis]|eukprot:PTQ48610.1 hypothetical protein MARPO_0005s0229 [Marchantia polymorpha]
MTQSRSPPIRCTVVSFERGVSRSDIFLWYYGDSSKGFKDLCTGFSFRRDLCSSFALLFINILALCNFYYSSVRAAELLMNKRAKMLVLDEGGAIHVAVRMKTSIHELRQMNRRRCRRMEPSRMSSYSATNYGSLSTGGSPWA